MKSAITKIAILRKVKYLSTRRKPGLINRHPSALFPRRLIACIMPIRANTIGPPFVAASVTQSAALNLFHSAFGLRDLFRKPRNHSRRDQLPAVRQPDRFVKAEVPVRGHQTNSSTPTGVSFT